MEDVVLTKTLKIKDGKLLRLVDDILEVEALVEKLKQRGYIPETVIDAKTFSKEEKLIEHEIIPYIIHSGEYTESMCYDVVSQALDMAIDLVDDGIFCWDVLPHNFTFYNGKWFLYDFDSILLSPIKAKSLVRGFFKLVFPNYEILKTLKREELNEYYLTRYRLCCVYSILPLSRFFVFFYHKTVCSLLLKFKQYKKAFVYLKKMFDVYTKDFNKYLYEYSNDEELFSLINKMCVENNIQNAFCVGEKAANWAINNEFSNSLIRKFVYLDNYKTCDEFYNFIVSSNLKNVSTAVLYPLINNNEISKDIKYRALYDTYAQQRFYSDAVISLDVNITDDYLSNLKKFSSKILILNSCNLSASHINQLKEEYECVEVVSSLIIAKNKKVNLIPKSDRIYDDANRGPLAKEQSTQVKLILHSKK